MQRNSIIYGIHWNTCGGV